MADMMKAPITANVRDTIKALMDFSQLGRPYCIDRMGAASTITAPATNRKSEGALSKGWMRAVPARRSQGGSRLSDRARRPIVHPG
jgi:hypothetical protein